MVSIWLMATSAGSAEKIFEVIDYLIQKESQ